MRQPQRLLRITLCSAVAVLAAAGLSAQTWQTRFYRHEYNISPGGGGPPGVSSQPDALIPFSIAGRNVTGAYGTMTGTVRMRYPNALPEARGTGEVGSILVLATPVTVGYQLEFDYVADSLTPPETVHSLLEHEIDSLNGNSPCRRELRSQHQSGTTTHFSESFECTFSSVKVFGGVNPEWVIGFENFIEFISSSSRCSFCGFLGQIYASYLTYSPLDLTVSRIEVVQVTQDVENSIRLVADKSTVARVFVGLGSEAAIFDPPTVGGILHGRNASGAALPGSPLAPLYGPIRAPNRPNRELATDSLFFRLPREWTLPGTITLRAEVNPNSSVAETDRSNNVSERTALFLERNELRVSWFPVCYDDTMTVECPTNSVDQDAQRMRSMFPVGDFRLPYTQLKVPTWTYKKKLATDRDQNEFMKLLRLRYELINDVSIDQLFAWLPNVPGQTGGVIGDSDPLWYAPTDSGRVAWAMADRYAWRMEGGLSRRDYLGQGESANLLAHEIGHNLGLRHTNTGDCNGCRDSQTDWPNPSSGRVNEVGYDSVNQYVTRAGYFDIMTYQHRPGYTAWMSPFHFDKLFNGNFRPMSVAIRESATDESYALVSGSAKSDEMLGRLDPMFVVNTSAAPPRPAADGNHCVRFSGASGTLSDFCFELHFETHRVHAELDEASFALRIPLPAGATRVSLRRGEIEIASRSASANPPTVTITSPAAGATWEGQRAVTWSGSDPDGDSLTYAVLYSPDGGTRWLPIETNTDAPEFRFDTAEIRSGDQIRFRVLASDGFRTAEATTGSLTVVAAPRIAVQSEADFAGVRLGTFGDATLLVTNHGEKALTIRAIRSSLADFAIGGSIPVVIEPNGRREIAVRFTPAAEGVRSSTISFESDDPARPVVTARVFGAGQADPQLAVTPTSLSFGEVAVGASRDLTLRIRNTGKGTLGLLAAGSSNSAFVVPTPAAPASILEGAEVVVTVRFRPVAGGAQAGTLSLVGTVAGSALATVALSGTGTGSGTACAQSVSPANFSIPTQGGTGSVTVSAPAGCTWTAAASRDWVTPASGPTGSGNGTVAFSVGPNSGSSRSAVITIGEAAVVIAQAGGVDTFVVPAVASTPGALGSFFKTAVQLHNPTAVPISGDLSYHPGGVSATEDDPSLPYELAPGQTRSFADLLPHIQQTGLGSLDLLPRTGTAPVATIRIFNDAGEAGTTGMTEELVRPGEALEAGKTGILIAPPEPSRARYNIGVRSLGFGAAFNFTVRDANGAVRTTGSKFLAPSYFAQQSADAFLGIPLLANDTISFAVTGGSAIVYGATTDNTTQDPSLQFARAIRPGSDPRRTIAAVAAAPGVNESLFKTTLQLHNPGTTAISGRLIFHPAATSGSDADPSVPYSLGPGATVSYPDILAVFQRTGLGSLDLVATTGPVPLAVARVFNDGGARGTTGFSVDALRPEDALQSGQTGVLIAPADPAVTRFNVGIRTLAAVSLTIVVRNRDGALVRTIPRIYPANYFEQVGGTAFAGGPIGPNDTVTVTVGAGSAIVYGASTDNKTQDPAMQVARALAP